MNRPKYKSQDVAEGVKIIQELILDSSEPASRFYSHMDNYARAKLLEEGFDRETIAQCTDEENESTDAALSYWRLTSEYCRKALSACAAGWS